MKRLIVLLIIVLFSIAGMSEAQSYNLVMVPHQGSADVGAGSSTVSFDIVFHPDGNTQIGNWAFNLFYDTSEMTWNSSQTTAGIIPAPLVEKLFGGPFENTPGLIENFSGLLSPPDATAPNISTNLILATVVFNVTNAAADGSDDVWFDKNNKIHFFINGNPVSMAAMPTVTSTDSDSDGIPDDGDFSGTIGDSPCTGGITSNCDDNCISAANPLQADGDGDMVGDDCDNCREVANADQRDTNAGEDDNTPLAGDQHYGNICDPDFDNDGLVKLADFNEWRVYYRQFVPPAPENVDLDDDGKIGLGDYNVWRQYYRSAPGPGIGD